MVVPSVGSATLVPFPRLLQAVATSMETGEEGSGYRYAHFALQGATDSVIASVLMELEAPAGILLNPVAPLATNHCDSSVVEARTEGRGCRTVVLSVGAGVEAGSKEMMLWLQPQCEPWRAFRMVLVVS